MTQHAMVALVQRFYRDLWTDNNLGAADDILEPDMVFVLPFARVEGREAMKQLVTANHHAFEALTYHTSEDGVMAVGTRAACEWRMTGRQVGAWNGIPATGNEVEIPGATFFDVSASGRIREARVHNHFFGLLQQLGAASVRTYPGG